MGFFSFRETFLMKLTNQSTNIIHFQANLKQFTGSGRFTFCKAYYMIQIKF